jgi:type IV pilus assembly protein PilB
MGVEPFLVASSVNLILAQRLVRKICTACKEPVEISDQALLDLGLDPEECKDIVFYHGKGCPKCTNTGFKGRVALYEVMQAVDSLKELVLQGASSLDIKKEAINQGMKTLRMSGITKFKEGVTTVEEVLRATVGDEHGA